MRKAAYKYILLPYYSRFETLGISIAVGMFAVEMDLSGFFYSLVALILTAFVIEIAKLYKLGEKE